MEGGSPTQRELKAHPLHSFQVEPRAYFNRVHSLVYIYAILGLFYHRLLQLFHCTTLSSFSVFLTMLLSEAVLTFMWLTTFSFRWRTTRRQAFPENLSKLIKDEDLPSLDVFICTADPYKEPPVNVVNTALSVMAFDYPTEKISVYVSDDGGSELTLFAFMEGAKFARHWLPFCRENGIEERCPEAYFRSTEGLVRRHERQGRERVMETGKVSLAQVTSDEEREAFKKWTDGFTRQNHPPEIQVLVESSKDVDVSGHKLPNLICLQREKNNFSPPLQGRCHNVLVRVSGVISNAPVVLSLDSDTYSNDPQVPRRTLCYLLDPQKASKLAFVQVPQRYQGINRYDTYASELKRLYIINPVGMDGLKGTSYVGTGCFFNRHAFYSGPSSSSSSLSPPPPLEVPDYKCNGTMNSCKIRSEWLTRLPAAISSIAPVGAPRWASDMGHSRRTTTQITDSTVKGGRRYSAIRRRRLSWEIFLEAWMMPLARIRDVANNAFWSLWSIPMAAYGFLPQLALLNQFQLFPKVSDPWFYLQGIFEFGVPSPLFVPLVMVATINLVAFVVGLAGALMHWNIEDMFVQLFISGFVVVISWPIYEAMVLRKDKGSMPIETTIKSAFLAGLLYLLAYFTFRI
ncbi:hypothetical protein AAC387_Pa12g1900 [Persea americana]